MKSCIAGTIPLTSSANIVTLSMPIPIAMPANPRQALSVTWRPVPHIGFMFDNKQGIWMAREMPV